MHAIRSQGMRGCFQEFGAVQVSQRFGRTTWQCAALRRAVLLFAPAYGQAFKPTRPIEFVVHTGPGGGNDVLARRISAMAEQEKLLPVRMQVVNKPGGGSVTAMVYVAEKKGDPQTIAAFANTWLTAPMTSAEAKVSWKDMTPIVRLVTEPAVIAVKAGLAVQDAQGFHRRGAEESRAS